MTSADASIDSALLSYSRDVIRSLQEPNGAYPASPTFSAYQGFCWFRDGAFIADGMSAAGELESAEAFHGWCSGIVRRYADVIAAAVAADEEGNALPDDQMLPARFTFAGDREGGDDWWDFQLDGFGTWLWALEAHATRHHTSLEPYADAIALTVHYLAASWQRPCYDWWEEHDEHVHVSTLGCIAAGLTAAARVQALTPEVRALAATTAERIVDRILTDGVADGHLVKWLGTDAVDASLASLIAPLGVIPADHPVARATLDAIERDLSFDRGVHRFVADVFYGGGQWPLLSCFVGLAHDALGDADEARAYLAWAAAQATDTLDMPEQVTHHLLAPEHRQGWIDKWGTVATPLLWSHAMLLRLATEV